MLSNFQNCSAIYLIVLLTSTNYNKVSTLEKLLAALFCYAHFQCFVTYMKIICYLPVQIFKRHINFQEKIKKMENFQETFKKMEKCPEMSRLSLKGNREMANPFTPPTTPAPQ